jgi:Peptidase C39 family
LSATPAFILLTVTACAAVTVASEAVPLPAAESEQSIRSLELLDVPYLPQTEALCGGAAAAMVMRYWGAAGVYAESFADLVDRDAGGIRGEDLLRALDARGWDARSFRGDAAVVQSHLSRRRPVVALVEDRPGRFHYVVVVAWPEGRVILHDPARAPYRVLTDTDFLRAWAAAGHWAMLLLPGNAPAAGSRGSETTEPIVASAPGVAPCGRLVDEGVRLARAGDVDAARRLFELAADECPRASGPRREMAGLHALRGAWREAAADAKVATGLDPADQHAWRILATASYLLDDPQAALDAWNRIGEPTVDLVNINGLERTRYSVAANAAGIQPKTRLTRASLLRARRRLGALPAAQTARVAYRPGENGQAQVDVVVIERPLLPTSTPSLVATAVRLVAERELSVALASPTGGGELWDLSWRWWEHRPRIALGFSAPAPFGGTWHVGAFGERQAYGPAQRAISERRRGASVGFSDWLGAATHWDVTFGGDRWDAGGSGTSLGTGVLLGSAVERHVARDTVVLSARASKWFGGIDAWTASARVDWQSSLQREADVWSARVGYGMAGDDAPLAIWHSAGTGQRADVLLRAHPVLDSGRIDDAVIGRSLVHAGVEWQHWLRPVRRVVRLAPAMFVDAGRASRGRSFSDTRAHVDVGAGLRIVLPGAGVVGVDVARGLRDGTTALSIGWRR